MTNDSPPDPQSLWAYKRGEIDDAEYTRRYREKLQTLLQRDPGAFEGLLSLGASETPQALACYCRAGVFRHRHLLLEFLETLADEHEEPFLYGGEIL